INGDSSRLGSGWSHPGRPSAAISAGPAHPHKRRRPPALGECGGSGSRPQRRERNDTAGSRGNAWSETSGGSALSAVHDQTVGQIVRRDRDAHTVARKHPNVVAAHAPRELSAYGRLALVQPDGVLTTTEGILNGALHL